MHNLSGVDAHQLVVFDEGRPRTFDQNFNFISPIC